MTPLLQVLAVVLLLGVPTSRSLKLEPLHHGNESALWKDLTTDDDDSDDDDTPKVVVVDGTPPKKKDFTAEDDDDDESTKVVVVDGPMSDDVELRTAPTWGPTEMMAPWAPAQMNLAFQFEQWRGSPKLRTTYKGFMEDNPQKVQLLAEKYDMPDVNVIALIAYSITDYHTINDILRGKLDAYTPEEINMAGIITQLATKGLDMLPSIGTTLLFRGTTLPAKYFENLEINKYFYEPAFLSTSTRSRVAAEFGSKPGSIILQIVCPPAGAPMPQCRGKDIKLFSQYPDEDEIVFPPGTKFAKVGEGEIHIDPARSQHKLFVLQPWL